MQRQQEKPIPFLSPSNPLTLLQNGSFCKTIFSFNNMKFSTKLVPFRKLGSDAICETKHCKWSDCLDGWGAAETLPFLTAHPR